MILYPAIDLKDGNCVRLYQGRMEEATVFGEDPGSQAKAFQEAGFEWLHVVDLDGAFQGKPANENAIKSILSHVTMPVQLGGGLRNMELIGKWLDAGISRIILGTVAQKNPLLVKEACRIFPDQIAVGIDAREGKVATDGWSKTTETDAAELALRFEDAGVCAIIYTDISRDGAMKGPNVEETVTLAQQLTTPLIASGGITAAKDISAYREMTNFGIEGVIIGRALYEGSITPQDALKAANP